MWYVSSNRDEDVYEDPDRFDVHRNPEHQAFGAGGRHFCLGAALARLELKILFEETLKRFPEMKLAGEPGPGGLGLPQPAEDAAGQLVIGTRGSNRVVPWASARQSGSARWPGLCSAFSSASPRTSPSRPRSDSYLVSSPDGSSAVRRSSGSSS